MKVRVQGSGPMSPMWEAMSKPLLPQLAKSFAGKLKAEIEKVAADRVFDPPESDKLSVLETVGNKLRNLWRAIFGSV